MDFFWSETKFQDICKLLPSELQSSLEKKDYSADEIWNLLIKYYDNKNLGDIGREKADKDLRDFIESLEHSEDVTGK